MIKLRHLILTIVALSSISSVYGVPARPGVINKILPDGSILSLNLQGDESHHQYFSVDGLPVFEAADGYFYYAELQPDNSIVTSQIKVSQIEKRSNQELEFISNIDRELILSNLNKNVNRKHSKKYIPTPQRSSYPTTGEQHALVILVEYTDTKFTITNPQEAFFNMMNQEGYDHNGATGSAKEYFEHVSNGQFKPTFDVYGPVTLAHEVSYYGGNTAYGDARPEEMIIEACQLVDDEIDFSLYDNDHNGEIDNVYVFYAGEGEASGGSTSTVWPHSWDIYDVLGKRFEFDGLLLNHYACSNEIYSGQIEGIGTFCHEFSHVLGLPDEYSTSYTSSFVPGNYSTLCYGCYNNDAKTPASYTLYQRYELGWVIPEEIGAPAQHSLISIENNCGYILRTSDPNEYFLLENRQQQGWDEFIPGHGMLVWHIDYDENVWYYNQPNDNPSHQYIDIEEADNILSEDTRDGDTFPGTAGITSFTDETRPSSISWNYEKLNKPINDIREIDGVIYFQISGGIPMEQVEGLTISDITPVSFKVEWSKIDVADGYYISVSTTTDGNDRIVISDYEKKDVGDISSIIISDLKPSTTYYVTITAYNKFEESEPSEECQATTLEATFDMLSPIADEASEVSEHSFIANWQALDGAQKYYLNVYDKSRGEAEKSIVDFTDGIKSMPEGYLTTTTATYASEAYSGNAVPSLRMTNDRTYIESPKFESDIRSFSFWHRGVGKSEGSEIVIYSFTDNEWKEFDRIAISNSEGGYLYTVDDGELFSTFGKDSYAIKIEFIKMDSGSLAIDDININYGGDIILNFLPDYEGKDMATSLTANIENLEDNHFYYYTVYASNGELNSRLSNEIIVRTTRDSSVDSICDHNNLKITAKDGVIIIKSDKAFTNAFVCNMQGQVISIFDSKDGEATIATSSVGVFIVNINGQSHKVIMQ